MISVSLPCPDASRRGLRTIRCCGCCFSGRVQKACDEPSISKEYLHGLQAEADSLRQEVDKIARYKLTNEILFLLKRDTPVGKEIHWIEQRDTTLEQEGLRDFFYKIKEKDIDYPSVVEMGLSQLITSLRAMSECGQTDGG